MFDLSTEAQELLSRIAGAGSEGLPTPYEGGALIIFAREELCDGWRLVEERHVRLFLTKRGERWLERQGSNLRPPR